jgi:uridine phosphorylase
MLTAPASHIRRHWFGTEDEHAIAGTVLLMERDRLEQYKAALDVTTAAFRGVFSGITGELHGRPLSVIHSIGPAHVADCVTFLAGAFGVTRFFATGSIGGLGTDIGDIVVANSCVTQDGYALTSFPDDIVRDDALGLSVELAFDSPTDVSQDLKEATRAVFDCDILSGPLFTVPAVCLENEALLRTLEHRGLRGIDLETGPFLAASRRAGAVQATCVHWVTDLPLARDFYYAYQPDARLAERDQRKKHRQWLNMPRLILPIVSELMDRP